MRLLSSFLIIIFFATFASADLYYWQDKDGNAHIADKIEKVPDEYRDKVRTQKSTMPAAQDRYPAHEDTVAEKKAKPSEELYGGQTLSWWTKKFTSLRDDVDRLENRIITKKKVVERYDKDAAAGKTMSKDDTNLYERYVKELPDDQSRHASLLEELDRLFKTARAEGVPKAARGE